MLLFFKMEHHKYDRTNRKLCMIVTVIGRIKMHLIKPCVVRSVSLKLRD